jgi:hypothetical protein
MLQPSVHGTMHAWAEGQADEVQAHYTLHMHATAALAGATSSAGAADKRCHMPPPLAKDAVVDAAGALEHLTSSGGGALALAPPCPTTGPAAALAAASSSVVLLIIVVVRVCCCCRDEGWGRGAGRQ